MEVLVRADAANAFLPGDDVAGGDVPCSRQRARWHVVVGHARILRSLLTYAHLPLVRAVLGCR